MDASAQQAGDREHPERGAAAREEGRGRPSVDQLSEWSFPASDPPPAWSWEVEGGARSGERKRAGERTADAHE